MTRSLSGYIPRPSTSLDKIISSTGLQVTAIKSSLPQRWLELMFAERQYANRGSPFSFRQEVGNLRSADFGADSREREGLEACAAISGCLTGGIRQVFINIYYRITNLPRRGLGSLIRLQSTRKEAAFGQQLAEKAWEYTGKYGCIPFRPGPMTLAQPVLVTRDLA
ncbi:hypothetical protein CISG_07862 [Coccidioides immitis RMSCC 3703]|uniref:Uncharacterized protein n=1 Tax=Coccidioides immitis RMSCC 3703 TaxID=454286 RepID=A0A0J8R3W9_COCIT|nr:hypothetical protein CISG_07862 [Coccidioides immitis RMSCC 3703]